MQNASSKKSLTVADIIADRFIQSLENGVAPWQKPWTALNPHNATTGRSYSGVNAFLLSFFGTDNAYLTFLQVKALGGKIEYGTKGLPVVYWKKIEKEENGEDKSFLICRYFTVFPLNKCGLPNFKRKDCKIVFSPVEQAEAIANLNKCPVSFGGSRAFYRPSTHTITLPQKETFKTVANYYATLFHEVGHSLADKHSQDKEAYAKEELVAELFASIALSHCNLLGEVVFDNSASYIGNWLSELKNDKTLIQKASTEAWRRWKKLNGEEEREEASEE